MKKTEEGGICRSIETDRAKQTTETQYALGSSDLPEPHKYDAVQIYDGKQ